MLLVAIVVMLLTFVYYFVYKSKKEEVKKEELDKEQEIIREEKEIESMLKAYDIARQQFINTKYSIFDKSIDYVVISSELLNCVERMSAYNSTLPESKQKNSAEINSFLDFIDKFKKFGENLNGYFSEVNMISCDYGKVNCDYFNYILSMKKDFIDESLELIENYVYSKSFDDLFESNPRILIDAVWFYALNKPFLLNDFENAKNVLNKFHPDSKNDIQWFIAEAYAINQMGGKEVLRNKVNDLLKTRGLSVDELMLLASSFMWMKAYNEEAIILNHMLSNKIQMTAKLQERLHSLSNGGENAPAGHDVVSKEDELFVDVSSLSWQDKEYQGFFENLIFQDKELSYSLAIRDEDKDLFISKGFSIPKIDDICKKVSELFEEEFGSETRVKKVQFNALSGNDIEKMEGFLAVTDACKQLGIFVHIARIGKKLNIKFYTLYMPEKEPLLAQKQKVMSIYRKINPIVNMWEKTITETILLAIQQILNTGTAATISTNENNTEVEF